MSCEAEEAEVDRLSQRVASKAAYCASVCSSGMYPAECEGCRGELADLRGDLAEAQSALAKCRASGNGGVPATRLLGAEGYVTFLRVNEPGSGFGGGSTNWFDADVIFKLDSRPDKGFGFQLRDDQFQPVRQGMLALLREALVHGLKVATDYNELLTPANDNSFVIRVALTKPEPGRPWPGQPTPM